jgi:hypothetical protein
VLERAQQTTGARKVSRKVAQAPAKPITGGASAPSRGTRSVRHDVARKRARANTRVTRTSSGGASAASNDVAPPPQVVAAAAGALAAELAGSAASVQALAYYRIPLFLLPVYKAAAAQYGVPWQILAAINEIETNYGNDLSVSTAGAVGWMQFMPATWVQYGVDALNAGYADPYNPVDAIFAAARYLRAAGAQSNLRAAILAYNHSEEYLNSVLLRAKLISTYPKPVIATLTGLVDAGLPVTGRPPAWGALLSTRSSASASARARVRSGRTGRDRSLAVTPGSSAPPSPSAAAARATSRHDGTAPAPQFVDLMSAPNAVAVAAQDGRITQLGHSRQLGRYVVLRDMYGDVFTYAGLGSVARSYSLPRAPRTPLRAPAVVADAREGSSKRAADLSIEPPLTLTVKTPKRPKHGAGSIGGGGSAPARSSVWTLAGLDAVRLLAHRGNMAAVTAHAPTAAAAGRRTGLAGHALPLRVGSLVAKGMVLGHLRVPLGAKDGHMRFAIRPAGDPSTIDPAPILANWVLLKTALHPHGAKAESDLLGATASDVFLLSKNQLKGDVLSDPGIVMRRCFRGAVASGAIDKRVLALLAFLSRSGLKPTAGERSCGAGARHVEGAVAISHINGVPIAGHQGAGSITDTTIRTLLTLRGGFIPRRIVSLMRYPGASRTLARADHADYIAVEFSPPAKHGPDLPKSSVTKLARSAGLGYSASPPLVIGGEATSAQWGQLIARIAALPAPSIPTKPSSAAIAPSDGSFTQLRVARPAR